MAIGSLLAGVAGGAGITIVIRAVDQYSGVLGNVNTKLLALGGAITAVGVAGAGLIGGLVKIAGEFEQTNIAFTTMLGSAEEAEKLLKELADFATKTPFTITGVEQNAKQLLAMGVETEDLLPTLKSLGDISAGLSVPLERLALNYGQVRIQGKLTGRELRDFAIAGVPLVAELAKNLNVSEEAIGEMVSEGKIGFDDVEKAFQTMTGEGGKFFDLMDSQSKTFLGQVSNIQDSMIKLGRIMGKVFLPIAIKVAEGLGKIVAWMEEHPKMAKFAAIALGLGTALALVVGPLLVLIGLFGPLLIGLATGTITVGALAAAVWALTWPVLAVIAAVAALVAIGWLLYKNWDFIKEKGLELHSFLKDLFAPVIALVKVGFKNLVTISKWVWDHGLGLLWDKMMEFREWLLDKLLGTLKEVFDWAAKGKEKITGFTVGVGKFIEEKGIIGSKQSGGIVERTGPYLLHKGEYVVPKNDVGGGLTVIIEGNVYGTDPDEIAEALQEKLKRKIIL